MKHDDKLIKHLAKELSLKCTEKNIEKIIREQLKSTVLEGDSVTIYIPITIVVSLPK